jgi:hypothetical protein
MLKRGIKLVGLGLSLLLFTISLAIATPAYAGTITLYEGNGGQQDVVAVYPDKPDISTRVNPNDEARSAVLNDVAPFTIIIVSDDPNGGTDDDYTVIKVKQPGNVTIGSFEQSFENDVVKVEHHHDNGLDGKVSNIKIVSLDF